jgi:hypothetical protein
MVSKAQRRWMWANDPEMAKEWEAHTPKGKKLPEHVKRAYLAGVKAAQEELRLKIPERTFHGYDAAVTREKDTSNKKTAEGNEPAAGLVELLQSIESPDGSATTSEVRDPLDRNTHWGPPSNLTGGDTASRMNDMSQPTHVGTVF